MSQTPRRRQYPYPHGATGGRGGEMARGMSQASRGLSLAFGFVIVVLLFWFAGRALDGWLETEPWFQIVGAVVGWALGVVTVYYSARHSQI